MSRLSNKKSASEALMLELRRFIAGVILFNQRVAERVGLNPTDMQCIHLIQLMGPLTAGKLAECTGLTTGGVTVVLDRMEKAGLVRRERNPNDRRSVLVHLQPATLTGIETHYAEIASRTYAFFASCAERDLRTVLEFFTRLNSLRDAPSRPQDKPGAAARPGITMAPSRASKPGETKETQTWQEPKNARTKAAVARSQTDKNIAARLVNRRKKLQN